MNKVFDVLVPKEFTITNNGKEEKKKQWNKVGRAWPSRSGDALNIELFHNPYVVMSVFMKEKNQENKPSEEAPF